MTALLSNLRTPATEERTCDQHGAYTSRNYVGSNWSDCPACQKDYDRRQVEARDAELRAHRLENRKRVSGLIGRFADASFDDYQTTSDKQATVLAACRQYCSDFQRRAWAPLWLIGSPGTGKTMLGSAIVRTLLDLDHGAEIHTARSLIAQIRATWKRGSNESEDDVVQHLGRIGCLVIDEVGVGFGTDAETTQLLDVIDLRYRLELPLVLISNLAPTDLRTALGDRLYDRLRENAKVLPCDWASHRGVRHD